MARTKAEKQGAGRRWDNPRPSKARSVATGAPVEPNPKAFGEARAILRAATAYVDALRPVFWGSSRWPAIEEARRA